MQIPNEVKDVSADVRGPYGEHVLSSFTKEADGDYYLRFTPYKKGTYTVDVKCKGKSVEGSPFRYVFLGCATLIRSDAKYQKMMVAVPIKINPTKA